MVEAREQLAHLTYAAATRVAGCLKLDAYKPGERNPIRDRIQSSNPDRARVTLTQPLNALHQRGLPSSVGPDNSQHLPTRHFQTDAADRYEVAVAHDEVLDYHPGLVTHLPRCVGGLIMKCDHGRAPSTDMFV